MNELVYGINIFNSPLVEEFINNPTKEHNKKKWMSEFYHKRIQKKWNKRFGFRKDLYFISTINGIYAHPNTVKKLINAMNQR